MKAWFTISLIVTAGIAAAFYCREHLWPKPIPPATTSPEVVSTDGIALELKSQLTDSGWSEAAAESTIALNSDRYCWLRREAPAVLDHEIEAWKTLQPSAIAMELLEKHPEMAGVLLLVHNPDTVAKGILDCKYDEDAVRIIGSFVKYTEPDEMSRWAAAVASHGPCIAELLRRCPAWPVDAMFAFPPSPRAVADEYSLWLDDVLSPSALPENDEETLSLIEFILAAGGEIRTRMGKDPDFRVAFRGKIWPAFARCVRLSSEERESRTAWELFASTPEMWDLLQRQDGEGLFKCAGLLAVDLLYGKDAVDRALTGEAARLLLLGKQELVERGLIGPWGRDQEFLRLMLRRNLTDDQLLTCCKKLEAAGIDWVALLNGWNKMTDKALAEDIGPPPGGLPALIPGFAIYYACKKLAQGRDVGWSDGLGVGFDILTLATLGSSKLLTESGKQAAKAALTQKLKKEAVADVALLTCRELAEQAADRELSSMVVHHTLKVLPSKLREQLLKLAVVDVTSVVQSSFRIASKLGLGRESIKKLSGLEARVFMRKDAKFLVSLPSAALGNNPCARFLNATAVNGAFEAAARTTFVQNGVVKTFRVASVEAERCQQNLACWWSGLATGAFDP
ncbi:MAG: hypothetical protein WCK77_21885 [Verrucomicrobiota bacterium]